jgi:hypothetical protein
MSFEFDERDADLPSYVFQALGAASMCWSQTPMGIFESTRAREIGEALLVKIYETPKPKRVLLSMRLGDLLAISAGGVVGWKLSTWTMKKVFG